ncbi:hypothetical protein Tco_0280148, partial [Tanacetum coccineum]
PVDYLGDKGDDGDDEDESSEDDDMDIEADDDDEEEEHPALANSVVVALPAPVPTPSAADAELARLLAISTLPSSPLSPCIITPPASPIRSLGYRASMIWLRAEAPSTSHSLSLPPPFILSYTRPTAPSSGTPPLHLLSTNRREDILEVTLPP